MAQGIISRYYSLGSGNSLNNILDGSQTGSVRTSGSLEEDSSYTIGQYAFAEGQTTIASGVHSHAEGYHTTASGEDSHAEGYNTTASGQASHAEGYQTTALKYCSHVEGYSSNSMPSSISITTSSGESLSSDEKTNITDTWNTTKFSLAGGLYSHVEGQDCLALEDYSHAEGYGTTASGRRSHAEGWNTEASGQASHAEGEGTTAGRIASHAEGQKTTASGIISHAEGYNTTASGSYSHASGYGTIANDLQTAIGRYNKNSNGPTGISDITGDIFIIGGGTSDTARKNALRTTTYGKTYGLSSFSSSGADYAEYFEWLDGNPDNEDRRGLFVTLDGEKIRIASSDDDFILGVVSSTPAFDGDSQSEIWHSMYLTDVFGEKLTETIEVPETTDKETGIVTPAHIETRWILNPDYDPKKSYEGREKRKEWTPVGLIGKLVVIDDGTCEVNGYCKVGENGKATKSEEKTSYRVMKRIDENHVRILIK